MPQHFFTAPQDALSMYGPLSSRHVVLFAAFKSIVREVTQDCLIWIDTQGCGVSLFFEV